MTGEYWIPSSRFLYGNVHVQGNNISVPDYGQEHAQGQCRFSIMKQREEGRIKRNNGLWNAPQSTLCLSWVDLPPFYFMYYSQAIELWPQE